MPDPAVPDPGVLDPAVPDPAVPDPAVPDLAVPDPVALQDLPKEVMDVHYITLNWTEPSSNGGNITHYTPYYRNLITGSQKGSWIKDDEEREDALHLWHSVRVSRGKTYEFVVTASNGHGESDKENIRRVNVLGKLQLLLYAVFS